MGFSRFLNCTNVIKSRKASYVNVTKKEKITCSLFNHDSESSLCYNANSGTFLTIDIYFL